MRLPWFRLTIDVDHSGEVRGVSYEVRSDDRIQAIHVLPEPGPFDTPRACLDDLLADLLDRYGIQLKIL